MDNANFQPQNDMMDVVDYYRGVGLNVMPLRCDGSKAPLIKWAHFQLQRIPRYRISGYFRDACDGPHPSGIGVIGGVTSGNLEILDFDDPEVYQPWMRAVAKTKMLEGLFAWGPKVMTPSGGRHLYYRTDAVGPNQKLAYSEDGTIAIETRGQGGQAVLPGSPPQTHHTGIPYTLWKGNWSKIPVVTRREREALFEVSRRFDKGPPKPERPKPTQGLPGAPSGIPASGKRPGEDFNERASWGEILEPKEWTLSNEAAGVSYWTRPGKPGPGISASTGHCGEMMHVFSSNASPFDADGTYSKFAAFALLWCDGDFSHAAKELCRIGFGENDWLEDDVEDEISQVIQRFNYGK